MTETMAFGIAVIFLNFCAIILVVLLDRLHRSKEYKLERKIQLMEKRVCWLETQQKVEQERIRESNMRNSG